MNEENKPLEHVEDLEAVLIRLEKKRAEAHKVMPIVSGELNSRDVCRLFIGPEWSHPFTDGPTTAARHVVAEQGLPLFEVTPGRWQVAHSLNY